MAGAGWRRLERRGGLFWILHLLFVLRRGGALFIGEDGLWYRGASWGKGSPPHSAVVGELFAGERPPRGFVKAKSCAVVAYV